ARPMVVLTSYNARVFTTVAELKRLIARGEVRYAYLNSTCGHRAISVNPACSVPVRWVRAHSTDVSREAGLREQGVLWRLPGVSAPAASETAVARRGWAARPAAARSAGPGRGVGAPRAAPR